MPKKMKIEKEYWLGVGRRKTATALVKIFLGKGEVIVNQKRIESPSPIIIEPLKIVGKLQDFNILAKVRGGGFSSQREAIRLGIARALIKYDPNFRSSLRKMGFLTRDPREKERKKPGLKRARKAPQWQKR